MNDALFVILIMVALIAWSVYKSRLQQYSKQHHAGEEAASVEGTSESCSAACDSVPDTDSQIGYESPKQQRRNPVHASPSETGKTKLKPASEEPDIRLKTASDARRAFIYSEIFNRKY